MTDSPLVLGLAAVFAGLTTVMVVAGAAKASPFVVVAAVPLGLTAAIMWYHATGRLARWRLRRGARARAGASWREGQRAGDGYGGARRGTGETARTDGTGTVGPDPWWTGGGNPNSGTRTDHGRRERAGGRRRAGQAADGRRRAGAAGAGRGRFVGEPPGADRMGPQEARRVLGVDPGDGEETVRRAYRERVKEVHPDSPDGDPEAFKRVTAAYERLTDG